MMTDSLATAQPAALAPSGLPAWVVPATPERNYTTVGITADGDLYIYGDSADHPGPTVPALVGVALDATLVQRGSGSRYGLRDYLDLQLGAPIPGEVIILRLPCQLRPHPETGEPQAPWSVRSLLGCLLQLDLREQAIKLQTRRGRAATFMRVFPYDTDGREQPELRAEPIGHTRDDLEIAIDALRRELGLAPQFSSVRHV